jgi:hypothetical protein
MGPLFLSEPQALDGFSLPLAVAEMRILPLGKISAENMEVCVGHLAGPGAASSEARSVAARARQAIHIEHEA